LPLNKVIRATVLSAINHVTIGATFISVGPKLSLSLANMKNRRTFMLLSATLNMLVAFSRWIKNLT
jgi:hypothetical protein